MTSRYLLDTHILVRWLTDTEPHRLSREQTRVLEGAVRLRQPLNVSAMTLLEIAMLFEDPSTRVHRLQRRIDADQLFGDLEENPALRLLPLTIDIAREAAALPALRDPADRVIVATARVHGLRLVTSDQRIIDSGAVSVVE